MYTIQTLEALARHRNNQSGSIHLVPTMGALHSGHLSLIKQANIHHGGQGQTWVSIFVNPLQFNDSKDLEKYPRPLKDDLELCRANGVHTVFSPYPNEFYPRDFSTSVSENSLAKHLCGEDRPGHFQGVCTVVLRLFNLTRAHAAFFGKKDYQQLAIIRRMVRDLALQTEIHAGETVREPDGLALSSRNSRLNPSQRKDAARLYRALRSAVGISHTAGHDPEPYLAHARRILFQGAPKDFTLHYLALVERQNLAPLSALNKPALMALAASYGDVRLIDNIEVDPPENSPKAC